MQARSKETRIDSGGARIFFNLPAPDVEALDVAQERYGHATRTDVVIEALLRYGVAD